MNTYRVYKVQNHLAVQDPDMPQQHKRYHTTLFVETNPDGSGFTHHVTGDLVTGMVYQRRADPQPDDQEAFHAKHLLGSASVSSYPEPFDSICKCQPAPPVQKAFNPATMKTEPLKADGFFYKPGETRRPLIKCTEWIEGQVIPALRREKAMTFLAE